MDINYDMNMFPLPKTTFKQRTPQQMESTYLRKLTFPSQRWEVKQALYYTSESLNEELRWHPGLIAALQVTCGEFRQQHFTFMEWNLSWISLTLTWASVSLLDSSCSNCCTRFSKYLKWGDGSVPSLLAVKIKAEMELGWFRFKICSISFT
jgi:hypothetical protein